MSAAPIIDLAERFGNKFTARVSQELAHAGVHPQAADIVVGNIQLAVEKSGHPVSALSADHIRTLALGTYNGLIQGREEELNLKQLPGIEAIHPNNVSNTIGKLLGHEPSRTPSIFTGTESVENFAKTVSENGNAGKILGGAAVIGAGVLALAQGMKKRDPAQGDDTNTQSDKQKPLRILATTVGLGVVLTGILMGISGIRGGNFSQGWQQGEGMAKLVESMKSGLKIMEYAR